MASYPQHRKNYNIPGDAHELTFSCYQRHAFLRAERTCSWLADSIEQARVDFDFDVWAFVFMPEHVHLLIRPRRAIYDMGEIRGAIKKPTSLKALEWLRQHSPQWIERLTRSRGKRTETLFWQSGGGYDRNVTQGDTLLAMIEYIHLNPVRRGLVEKAADWRWSSAGHFCGGDSPIRLVPIPPEWLL